VDTAKRQGSFMRCSNCHGMMKCEFCGCTVQEDPQEGYEYRGLKIEEQKRYLEQYAARITALEAQVRYAEQQAIAYQEALEVIRRDGERIASLTAENARVTTERDAARANARVLAHSYEHDSNPPQRVVSESLAYPIAACAPPAPQRFWVVGPMLTNADMWLCVTVDERGQLQTQHGPPRMTRAEAEADGAASGLPRWPGEGR